MACVAVNLDTYKSDEHLDQLKYFTSPLLSLVRAVSLESFQIEMKPGNLREFQHIHNGVKPSRRISYRLDSTDELFFLFGFITLLSVPVLFELVGYN